MPHTRTALICSKCTTCQEFYNKICHKRNMCTSQLHLAYMQCEHDRIFLCRVLLEFPLGTSQDDISSCMNRLSELYTQYYQAGYHTKATKGVLFHLDGEECRQSWTRLTEQALKSASLIDVSRMDGKTFAIQVIPAVDHNNVCLNTPHTYKYTLICTCMNTHTHTCIPACIGIHIGRVHAPPWEILNTLHNLELQIPFYVLTLHTKKA